MNFANKDDLIQIATTIRTELDKCQPLLVAGNGIMINGNVISLGVFQFVIQPITFDEEFINKPLNILKDDEIVFQTILTEARALNIYLGNTGTYKYEIEGVPGIVTKRITKTYLIDGLQESFNIDYEAPVKADMYPFATATDDQLVDMLNSYYMGLYDTNEIEELRTIYLPVGAKRSIHLSHMESNNWATESHFGENGDDYDFIIIGFNHDDLINPLNGYRKALLTLNQERILYKDTTSERYFYNGTAGSYGYPSTVDGGGTISTDNNSGNYTWETCNRRKWCNDTYFNALPYNIRNNIKPVYKPTGIYNGNQQILKNLEEKVFLLSEMEIFGERKYTQVEEGSRYEHFLTPKNTNKKPAYNGGSPSSPNSYDSMSAYYWLRSSPPTYNYLNYVYGKTYGGPEPIPEDYYILDYSAGYFYSSYSSYGITPAFCL